MEPRRPCQPSVYESLTSVQSSSLHEVQLCWEGNVVTLIYTFPACYEYKISHADSEIWDSYAVWAKRDSSSSVENSIRRIRAFLR